MSSDEDESESANEQSNDSSEEKESDDSSDEDMKDHHHHHDSDEQSEDDENSASEGGPQGDSSEEKGSDDSSDEDIKDHHHQHDSDEQSEDEENGEDKSGPQGDSSEEKELDDSSDEDMKDHHHQHDSDEQSEDDENSASEGGPQGDSSEEKESDDASDEDIEDHHEHHDSDVESAEKSETESENNFHNDTSDDLPDDDEDDEEQSKKTSELLAIALDVAQGDDIPSDHFHEVQEAADNWKHDRKRRYIKYILCANAAQHCGFIEPNYFGNLSELLSTKNVIIRQCIMWAFASVLPCKNILSPLLIRLLFKSLKDPTLGWSLSYLFRKISEYDKYIRMVRYVIWLSMSNLIFDRQLSEQVRMTLVYTLNNVHKKRKWIAPVIKHRFEKLIQTDGIETRVLLATVQSLHSMVISGAQIDSSTVNRLKHLIHTGDYSSMESIRELVDFIDNKRILSNVSNAMLGGNVKKELTATQTTSVSRSEEEAVEPTVKLQSMDHLMNTVGHLGRSFNAESKPIDVQHGNNTAWYRTTWYEVENLGALAKKGQLKDEDFDYLLGKFDDGLHWGVVPWTSRVEIYEMVAVALKDAAEQNQSMSSKVISVIIKRLSGTNAKIHRNCAEALLLMMKNRQSFTSEQMNDIEKKLQEADDTIVKQHLIELYALYVSKGHNLKLDLDSISDDLLNEKTCETASYLFFKAASLQQQVFSATVLDKLSQVAKSNSSNLRSRDNCLWALAYSIKATSDKTSIPNEVIDTLSDLLLHVEKNIRQTAAIAVCYYGIDESTDLSPSIIDRLALILKDSDENLFKNILSVYLRVAKQDKDLPDVVLEKLIPLLFHEEFTIRETTIWIFKHIVNHRSHINISLIEPIEKCLQDAEFPIRNTSALLLIDFWRKQIYRNDSIMMQNISNRMESFLLTIFSHSFNLEVQQSSLKLLQSFVERGFVLSETLIHLIECCLYDREETMSKIAIDILQTYSTHHPLLSSTLVCLEDLLTRETPILDEVILLLQSLAKKGRNLSKKAIDVLAQLLFKASDPKPIRILLTHADRNQPLAQCIDELLQQIYYSQVLQYSTCEATLNKATSELLRATSQGKSLCVSVLDLVFQHIESDHQQQRASLMPILVNVVANGQSINKTEYLSILETIFFQQNDELSVDLMLIFTHLSRQNQSFSDDVLILLENYLEDVSIHSFIIEIYQHLIERQKPLDASTIQKIFRLFFNEKEWENFHPDLQYRLASFVKSIAENRSEEFNQRSVAFLLQSNQPMKVLKEICLALQSYTNSEHGQLHSDIVDRLIQLVEHDHNDVDLQKILLGVLRKIRSTNTKISECLDYLELNDEEDDRILLDKIHKAENRRAKLTDALIDRLSHMIYSCDLQVKTRAAALLASSITPGKTLPKRTINALSMTLRDEAINEDVAKLLLSHAGHQSLPTSTIDDLIYLVSHSSDQSVRSLSEEILKQQMKYTPTKIDTFFRYYQSKDKLEDITDIPQLLKILRTKIIIEQQLDIDLILDHFVGEYQNEIIDLLLLAHEYSIPLNEHAYLIVNIETALQHNPTDQLIDLIFILIKQKVKVRPKTQDILFDKFSKHNHHKSLQILEYINQQKSLPEKMIVSFSQCLTDPSKREFLTEIFAILCHSGTDPMKIFEQISLPSFINRNQLKQMKSMNQSLHIIQTLLFVNYLQPEVFEQPTDHWSRNSLAIEILMNSSDKAQHEMIEFYQRLDQFEQFKQYPIFHQQRDLFLQRLIIKQRQQNISLSMINDIFIYSLTTDDQPLEIISSDHSDWFIQLRRCFIKHRLTERFSQNSKYTFDHLIEPLTNKQSLSPIALQLCLRLFQSVKEIGSFLDLLDSSSLTRDELQEIFSSQTTNTGYVTLQKQIESVVLTKTLKSNWIGSTKTLAQVQYHLQTLIEQQWPLDRLLDVLTQSKQSKTSDDLGFLMDILKILVDYQITPSLSSLQFESILKENSLHLCSSLIYQQVIEYCLGSTSSEKNLNALVSELGQFNSKLNIKHLRTEYEVIEQKYKSLSSIMSGEDSINTWSKETIQSWADRVRQIPKQVAMSEMLAVIKRAVYLDSKFEPRAIQILTVLILLETKDQHGRLLQVLTGEGKSTIVSILAVIKALENKHVDIITSSITLAKRDAEERQPFYDYFNVTVSHNNDETSYSSGPKDCYQADIVYGNSSQFQFDLLRHEFSLLNTRTLDKNTKATRRFDVVIIDEVDSMLIDENNTLARLADQLPGMEWLNPLLFGIWRCIDAQDDVCSKRDAIIDHMKQLLVNPEADLKIPQHLTRFVNESIPIWVDHALLAKLEYRLDHHYMIKSDESRVKRIMPIDFSNTGVVQPTTTWSDGLHQFLQIKHGLKLTPLTITTNYLSNIGLFTRYGKNIFGLTGTIGSTQAQELLRKTYGVDTIIIPSFKQKRHHRMKPIITSDDDQWLSTIVSETLTNARRQRAILIICETRLDAKTISKQIQRADQTFQVRLYTDNTDAVESNVVGNRIQPGEIIVATNLAGRGTDLKTSPNVETKGGLHVCLTFLPTNVRVEDQAFGRTSRQGQRGTAQMILSAQRTFQQLMNIHPDYLTTTALTQQFNDPMEKIRGWRQEAEKIQLDRMWKEEIQEIKQKDRLFRQFCQLLDKMRQKKDDVYRLLSLKELWGLWLKSMDVFLLNRRRFRQSLEEQDLICEDVTQDGHSFFHAVSKQLQGALTSDEIREQVLQHLINHAELYPQITEEERHQATAEALNITLNIYRTDSHAPHIYARDDPIQVCSLGYEVDSYYFSLGSKSPTDNNNAMSMKKQDKSKRDRLVGYMKKFVDRAKEQQKDKLIKALATPIIDSDVQKSFNNFAEDMEKTYLDEKFIRNPCYYLMEAESLVKKLSSWSNTFRSAWEYLPWTEKQSITHKDVEDRLKKAIELDPIFTFTAKVTQSHLLIDQSKSDKSYKIKAKTYLNEAQEILAKFIIPQLHSMQIEPPKNNNTDNDELIYKDLIHQIHFKVEILEMFQNHVSQAIATIEDSQKFIDVTFIDHDYDPNRIHLHKNLYRDEVKKVIDAAQGKVSLTFHSLKSHKDLWTHDQAVKLLDVIKEKNQDVSLRYFNGSMEKVKALESIVTSETIRLTIEYLDSNELHSLIENRRQIDLQLTSNKDDYLSLVKAIVDEVRKPTIGEEIVEMLDNLTLITKQHHLISSAAEALRTLQDKAITVESILFKSINKAMVDFIIAHVKQPSFALTFNSLTFDVFKQIIKDVKKPFDYEFRQLSTRQGKRFVEKISDREFHLLIEDISVSRAKKIIEKFDRNEQDVTSALKFIVENIPKDDQQQAELNSFNLLGVSLLINVDELGPRPWISASIVIVGGVLQIAGGVALTAVTGGLGVTLGISLIGEGINDIIFGIRGALSRRFSWKDYAIQKGISLAICLVSLGTSAVFQAVKGAQAVGVSATVAATRQGTWMIIKNSFRVVPSGAIQGISQTTWSLAFKQVAVTCAETGVRELANYISDSAYQGILSQVKDLIREEIDSNLRVHQSDKDFQRVFNRALTVDRYYGNDQWRKQIEQIAMDILTKHQDQFLEAIQSTSKGITNAFLNHSRQFVQETGNKGKAGAYIKGAQLLLTIGPMIKGANDLRLVTDSFFNQYLKEVKVLEDKLPKFEALLIHASNQELSSSISSEIVQKLAQDNILTADGLLHRRFNRDVNEDEPDFSNQGGYLESNHGSARTPQEYLLKQMKKVSFDEDKHREYAEAVLIKILNNRHQSTFRISMFQKKIVDLLTDRFCAIIYGTMVAPMKNFIISQAIASLSTTIQLKLDPKGTITEQLMQQGAKRYIHGVANDLIREHNAGEQTLDPKAEEKVDRLIGEMKENPNRPTTENEKMAMNVLNGAQGGNIELIIMALLTKKRVAVIDSNASTDTNVDDGTIRVTYTPPRRDEATGKIIEGHYEMVGGTTVQGGSNDCLYTAMMSGSKSQFSSVEQLRKNVAGVLLTSPNFIAGIHPALSIINQARDPVQWKELMGQGGARNVPPPPTFPATTPVKTTQQGTEEVAKDAEKYLKHYGKGNISEEAAADIIKDIRHPENGLGNFHRENNRDEHAVVEIELTYEITHKVTKETQKFYVTINADEPDPHNKTDHVGCKMFLDDEKKVVTHKALPNDVLTNKRPTGNQRGCVNETSSVHEFRTQDKKYDVKVTRNVHRLRK